DVSRAVVDRCQKLRDHRKSQVAVNRNLIVEKLANVDRYVLDTRTADLDRVYKPIDDFKLPAATDRARQPASRNRLETEFLRRLIGDDRHTRTSIEHKAKRLPVAVYANQNDGTIVSRFESNTSTIITGRNVQRTLVAEITQEVDQAADTIAPIDVGLGRDH